MTKQEMFALGVYILFIAIGFAKGLLYMAKSVISAILPFLIRKQLMVYIASERIAEMVRMLLRNKIGSIADFFGSTITDMSISISRILLFTIGYIIARVVVSLIFKLIRPRNHYLENFDRIMGAAAGMIFARIILEIARIA